MSRALALILSSAVLAFLLQYRLCAMLVEVVVESLARLRSHSELKMAIRYCFLIRVL